MRRGRTARMAAPHAPSKAKAIAFGMPFASMARPAVGADMASGMSIEGTVILYAVVLGSPLFFPVPD